VIILDEQLAKEPGLTAAIQRWYDGTVTSVVDLG
jgi:hypothetical protein